MNLRKLFVTSAVLSAAGLLTAQAGPAPMAPAPVPAPVGPSSLLGDVTGEVSVGVDTHYIFRGVNLGEDAYWSGVNFDIPLTEGVSFGFGSWYINPTDVGDTPVSDDELDLTAGISSSFGGLDVYLGYTAYLYPETSAGDTHEVGIAIGKDFGGFGVSGGYYYDWELESHYFEIGAAYGVEVTDYFGDELDDYFDDHFDDYFDDYLDDCFGD